MENERRIGAARRHFAVSGLIAVTLLAGCKRESLPNDLILPPADWTSVSITLVRAPGRGPSPSYTVAIQGDGSVEYEGKDRVPVLGRHSATVPQEKILVLLQEVNQTKFMFAKDRDFSAFDTPSLTVVVSMEGKTEKMKGIPSDRSYYPSEEALKKMNPLARAELSFLKLANDINATAGTERWINCSPACLAYISVSGTPRSTNGEAILVSEIEREEPLVQGSFSITPQVLVEAGADVNLADSQGTTPLMAAAKRGDADLVRDLLAHGAIPDAKDKKGRSALDLAKIPEIRNLLSSASYHT